MLGTALLPRRTRARSRLGAALAAALALFLLMAGAPTAGHAAGPTTEPATTANQAPAPATDEAAEPFGRPTTELGDSALGGKWQTVRRSIDAELGLVSLCRLDLAFCPSPAAIEFLSIVERARSREGLARLGEVNRAINLDVRPVADIDQYGVEDFWSSPLATLAAGAGDCEDYAIAKFVALREAGIPSADLRLVILRDVRLHADHAVVAVRIDQRWRILDSRRLLMLEDAQFIRFQTLSHFEPIFSIGDGAIRRYDDSALVATAQPVAPIF
jgi:predicted transglutaminase-like cysteine proteinase